MNVFAGLTWPQRKTFFASFLGWTLDSYDFFLVIVVVPHLAKDFNTSIVAVGFAVTLTLMLRPLGALIFGWFADRFGRRVPLMVDIGLYSLIELLTAFSPNLGVFLVLRALFGIAMGGEWGLGAALAMESLPSQRRGFFSGLLQEGYAVGNLLAGLTLALLYTYIGWRGMFVLGALPALVILYIRAHVPESPAWVAGHAHRLQAPTDILLASVKRYWVLFLYAIGLMTALNYMSHGTQDLYPTYLAKQRGFDPRATGFLNAISACGAIVGGILFGTLSQRFGRRAMMLTCSLLGIAMIPLWAFSTTFATIALGGFLIQVAVQGAWGIIPAHLNEISPPLVRGTFPGLTYQIGNLISANALQLEAAFAKSRFPLPHGGANYALAMAIVTLITLFSVVIMTALGYFVTPERRGADFYHSEAAVTA